MQNSFLERIITDLLSQSSDLSEFTIVLPGKRPIVFIKKILKEKQYSGFLPDCLSIEDLITKIANQQPIQGVGLWLFAYDVYRKMFNEDFGNFLKWFPTLLKDWDDILKFSENEKEVLEYMFQEERIKKWSENLGEKTEIQKRFLNFWQKMNQFLPKLKEELNKKNWATSGIIHEMAKEKIQDYAKTTDNKFIFCGFNAFTPVEKLLVKELLQWDKAKIFFQTDEYYMNDEKQEAGKFLRSYKDWKEFSQDYRPFNWIDQAFKKEKKINLYDVPGNVMQTKVLPQILKDINEKDISETAVVLLDENLLPASLDALFSVKHLNITMGFPVKNLAFSNAIKQLFYIQKQLKKKSTSYYHRDIISVLESLPNTTNDSEVIADFSKKIVEQNIVYLSPKKLEEILGKISYFQLFRPAENTTHFLELLVKFCKDLKENISLDDIQYENISHFQDTFRIIKNQISEYSFPIDMETLELLINQLVNTETIDFKGEPLQGLQIMGLLETRLLNFKNIILLSVNEGKLPLGNTQNTYLPYDVRQQFNLHTFLENDSIYAYHFYRLLQEAENIHLLYNSLSSGVNTGEKSRFITQIEMESPHTIEKYVIENHSNPTEFELITIEKTKQVLEKLEKWKNRVSASHLVSYLYDPIEFYYKNILGTYEVDEIEEQLSQRSYGNLVHYTLQELLEKHKGKVLKTIDLENSIKAIDKVMDNIIIERMKHQIEFYDKGMNYIHKSIAKRVVQSILEYDLKLIKNQNKEIIILDIERKIENISFPIDDNGNEVNFYGYIDRIDSINGEIRIIDYKTAKTKNIELKFSGKNNTDKTEFLLKNKEYKQALQLCIYLYYAQQEKEFSNKTNSIKAGIWSFAEVNKGVQELKFEEGKNLSDAMVSIKNLINEILNPAEIFKESEKINFNFND